MLPRKSRLKIRIVPGVVILLAIMSLNAYSQTKIAYSSNESGNLDIFVIELDYNLNIITKTKLTDWSSAEYAPCWSMGGTQIAFTSTYEGGEELWIMNANGSNKRKVTNSARIVLTEKFASDDTAVYGLNHWAGDGEVARFDIATGNILMLTNIAGYNTQSFDVNSDETKITFVRGVEGNGYTNRLFTADFVSDGTDFESMMLFPGVLPAPHEPRFSPDDSRIAFTLYQSYWWHGLGIINADGTEFWTPIPVENRRYYHPDWIDNDRIIFTRQDANSNAGNLFVLDLSDMSIHQVTDWPCFNHYVDVLCPWKVLIDIKPGSFPNPINLESEGSIPVAIFSDSSFDATQIDPRTVSISGANVRIKQNGTLMYSFEDVNGDGLMDIVIHFSTQALQLSPSDAEAVLEGRTFDGLLFRGVDFIIVVSEAP